MKSFMVIMGMLAVTTVVCGLDYKRLLMFNHNAFQCKMQLDGFSVRYESIFEAVECALRKDGEILDKNGEIIKDEALNAIGNGISDASRREQAQSIFTECYDKGVQTGNSGKQQTMEIIKCSITILDLLDRLD